MRGKDGRVPASLIMQPAKGSAAGSRAALVRANPLHTYTQAWKQASGDPSGVRWNYRGITLLYKF